MRRLLTKLLTPVLTSGRLQGLRRSFRERRRRLQRRPHLLHYFHQLDDPYSALSAQLLPALQRRYQVEIRGHLCPPPSPGAAPEPELLLDYSRADAALLAPQMGEIAGGAAFAAQPPAEDVQRAQRILAAASDAGDFAAAAGPVSAALWRWQGASSLDEAERRWGLADGGGTQARLEAGARLREKLGHYLGSTFHYEGEWYWSPSRLHYLEERLQGLGAQTGGDTGGYLLPPRDDRHGPGKAAGANPAVIEMFLSLRSPYSYLACERAFDMARSWGAEVEIRYILPMVMRSLPVPQAKGRYIIGDCAREARRLGIPFGRIADPVGKPVERAMPILARACEIGKGEAFLRSFMRGVWAEGVDAGTDSGMARLVSRAGLDWGQMRSLMADEAWRAPAEANREELFAMGFWGAPTFRLGDVRFWGRDRMWRLSDALEKGTPAEAAAPKEASPAKGAGGAKAAAEKDGAARNAPAPKKAAAAAARQPAAKRTPAKPAAKKTAAAKSATRKN